VCSCQYRVILCPKYLRPLLGDAVAVRFAVKLDVVQDYIASQKGV
jgi:hypothetical protein